MQYLAEILGVYCYDSVSMLVRLSPMTLRSEGILVAPGATPQELNLPRAPCYGVRSRSLQVLQDSSVSLDKLSFAGYEMTVHELSSMSTNQQLLSGVQSDKNYEEK